MDKCRVGRRAIRNIVHFEEYPVYNAHHMRPPRRFPAFLFLVCAIIVSFAGCAGGPPAIEILVEEEATARLLSGLTLRQRIGQRFIGWIPRAGISEEIEILLESGEIGGFILYPWNYDTIDDVRSLTSTLQGMSAAGSTGIPLFLAADQEGGRVVAFRFAEFVQLPSAFSLASLGDEEIVEAAAYANAVQLRSIGVNMNLAPVLDLYPLPDRTIIGDRSFGDDEVVTAAMGKAFVRGTLRGGIFPVIKHFPGHGLSSVDSHGNLPIIESLDSDELARHIGPFRAAIDAGAPGVMPAHLLFPAVDSDYPVTLSEAFIVELLRGDLQFEGLIVSDGLSMGALSKHYTLEDTLARCFQVGIDAILVHSKYSILELVALVEGLVERGVVTQRQVDEGLLRMLSAKKNAGILK